MKLTLDIGNTRTKVALFDGDRMVESAAPEHVEAYVHTLCRHHAVSHAVACCVGTEPDWTRLLPANVALTRLTKDTPLPFAVDYLQPQSLGTDRLALALGAWHRHPKERTLVIDAGSCITLDLLEGDTYRGGAILPGINMQLRSMHEHTTLLPLVAFEGQEAQPVGRSTAECMLSGSARATAYALEGYLSRLEPQHVLITGGDGAWLHHHIDHPSTHCPHLLMEGLNTVTPCNHH